MSAIAVNSTTVAKVRSSACRWRSRACVSANEVGRATCTRSSAAARLRRGVRRACASTPGPVGAAPVRARWLFAHQRRRPRPPHTAPGRGKRRCEPRLASPTLPPPRVLGDRHGGSVGRMPIAGGTQPQKARPENLVVAATAIAEASPFPRHCTKTPRECPGGRRGRPKRPGTAIQAGLAARKRRVGAVRGAVPAQNEPKVIVGEQKREKAV